eukprot:GHVT01001854.1.p1 GENE.GHVT01001854.1~~GHVT01001854.1.p1  ORF type:complete len:943 (+),score=104.64 GHVT01001854.1:5575-8403(+)
MKKGTGSFPCKSKPGCGSFRLYPDLKDGASTTVCVLVASALNIPLEVVTSSSTGSTSTQQPGNATTPEISGGDANRESWSSAVCCWDWQCSTCVRVGGIEVPATSASVAEHRPLLLGPSGVVSGVRAVCSALVAAGPAELAVAFRGCAGTSNAWRISEWTDWAIDTLRAALVGVNQCSIIEAFDYLEAHLNSTGGVLVCPESALGEDKRKKGPEHSLNGTASSKKLQEQNNKEMYKIGASSPFIADFYVWTILRWHRYSGAFIGWPSISRYFSWVSQSSPVISALSRCPPPPKPSQWPISRSPNNTKIDAATLSENRSLASPSAGECKQETNTRPEYYVTTAINYTNGPPHMGHAYEAITSDVISRYHRLYGRDVYFLTGTDEHGQKIANTAALAGKSPKEMCDGFAEGFQVLNRSLDISNDFFIRTTMESHKKVCQALWNTVKANGDIYLDTYVGWYCEREETFVTEMEAKLTDYKDPVSGKPYSKMEEASYFFRMSKYQTRLIKHINDNPECIQPENRRQEILLRLAEPLSDLSCSRTSFSWGVPVPGDPKHIMYVWFDALTNYYSGCDPPNGPRMHYWPADVHVIGKDIAWFHTVIWPCMLMAAGIPLAATVFCHGFVTAADGRKMSKSLGNVVSPADILKSFSSDTFRYFIIKEAKYGADLRFDVDNVIDLHNSELADVLGNLAHRATSLCAKFCDGKVPAISAPEGAPPFDVELLAEEVKQALHKFQLQEISEAVIAACKETNKYLTEWAPWSLSDFTLRQKVVRAVLEAVYVLAHFLDPIIPNAAGQLFHKLRTERTTVPKLSVWYDNLLPGTQVEIGDILFEKKKPRVAELLIQRSELRVATVVSVLPPPAKAGPKVGLLTVAVDPGAAEPRTALVHLDAIGSPTTAPQSATDLVGAKVVVLCNVKNLGTKGVSPQVVVMAMTCNQRTACWNVRH